MLAKRGTEQDDWQGVTQSGFENEEERENGDEDERREMRGRGRGRKLTKDEMKKRKIYKIILIKK